MPGRKHIAAFLLCIAAVVPMLLSSFFLGGRIVVRHMMLEKLEHESLQTIRLHHADLRWYKKGHEIVVDGRMFDVKKLEIQGDTCVVSGLFDDNETELFDQLVKTEDSRKESSNPGASLFHACLGITAIKHMTDMPDFRIAAMPNRPIRHRTDSRLIQRPNPVFTPPPEL
jgi:hypothetical protein